MSTRFETGLFEAIEKSLKNSTEAKTCTQLYDEPEIRANAQNAKRVSDYLGNLWRRGYVARYPAPKLMNDASRWMYVWKPVDETAYQVPQVSNVTQLHTSHTGHTGGSVVYSKPNIQITENGSLVTIDLPNLTLTIRTK